MTPSSVLRLLAPPSFAGLLGAALALLVSAGFAPAQESPLRVAVYDVPPDGHVEPDGTIDGVSVDLWRRAADEALIEITGCQEWRQIEDSYFGRQQ